jgi:hypothetical protein
MNSPDAMPWERWLVELTRFRIEMTRLSYIAVSMPANLPMRERSTREAEITETIRICSLTARRLATAIGAQLNLQSSELSRSVPNRSWQHHAKAKRVPKDAV